MFEVKKKEFEKLKKEFEEMEKEIDSAFSLPDGWGSRRITI